MSTDAQLLIDHTIANIWDHLPEGAQVPEHVESEMLETVVARLKAFRTNPQAFRPRTPIDKNALKQRFAKAYAAWTDEETHRLSERYRSGASVTTLMGEFERSRGAIVRRLERLRLIDLR